MTRDFINGEITSREELDSALGQVLMEAIENELDPRGSWVYHNGQSAPDWEVMIYELEKFDSTE